MRDATDQLYVREHCKFGSMKAEQVEFQTHVERVRAAQATLAKDHSAGVAQRVFHHKSHGCLAGRLHLLDERPDSVRHGMFASGGKSAYNVLARFSSGVGFDQHDLKPDVRGLSLKIFGVEDASASDGAEAKCVDWLMTNSTNPFGTDQEEFVSFMEASVAPGLAHQHLIGFFLNHKEVAGLLVKSAFRIVPSLLTEQYWSGHAYLLGPEQAMKFNVRPLDEQPFEIDAEVGREMAAVQEDAKSAGGKVADQLRRWLDRLTRTYSKANADYLAIDLSRRMQQGSIKLLLSVQLEVDPQRTPIEDGLVEWKESDSPSIAVAELVLDRLLEGDICNDLRFTPGHFVADHRPLGNIGRGRVFTYEASQTGRGAAIAEPEESLFFPVASASSPPVAVASPPPDAAAGSLPDAAASPPGKAPEAG